MNRRKFFRFLPAIPVLGVVAVETAKAASIAKPDPGKIVPTPKPKKLPPVRMPSGNEEISVHLNGQFLRPGPYNDFVLNQGGIFFEHKVKAMDIVHLNGRWAEADRNYRAGELFPYSLFV
jgi:hypothetical protein